MYSSTNDPSAAVAVDTTPLLGDRIFRARPPRFFPRPPSLRGAAQFLRRASSRSRPMREPSVRVREAAAEEIEERHSDWAYSKPIVILDIVWNIAFVIVSISVLIMSQNETPSMLLRLWIIGYALQCVLHVLCVGAEYMKRYSQPRFGSGERGQFRYSRNLSNSSSGSDDMESGNHFSDHQQSDDETSVAKHLESANTMFSFIWWIIGFYWVSAGGQSLVEESPQLYWLCVTFLAFDVFFVVICVAVACAIGLAVCCCLPCIIAILYAVADQEGASKEDIEKLPRYRFQKTGDLEKHNSETQGSYGGIMTECDTDSPTNQAVPLEDAECCICLCAYDDGVELRELPCGHHFHSACIDKWLCINATCPLCKFNILKNSRQSGSEDA